MDYTISGIKAQGKADGRRMGGVGLQYILDSEEKKKVQEDAKSVIVELHKQQ